MSRLICLSAAAVPYEEEAPGLAGSTLVQTVLLPALHSMANDLSDEGKSELMQGALGAMCGVILGALGEKRSVELVAAMVRELKQTAAAMRHGMN